MAPAHRLFGVTGWKNVGKTTLVARLVTELAGRGYVVSTVKHAHHSFEIDREGTDSWKHRRAGSRETLLVSSRRWALMHEFGGDEEEPPMAELLAKLAACDLVLIEGYKREPHPKIEILRDTGRNDAPRWPDDPTIVAVAAETPPAACRLPCFHPDDIGAIAAFVLNQVGLKPAPAAHHAAE
jgi:molybdopterin-guanine dinucleotide biosynthesis protein B